MIIVSDQYPFLITVPHGGLEVPPEVRDLLVLSDEELRFFSDPAAGRLYDYHDRVAGFAEASTSRMIVDLNRPPYHLAPRYPDGVTKSKTLFGGPVYREGSVPDITLVHQLLVRHFFPFQEKIDRLLDAHGIRAAFDCHTMLGYGPPLKDDAGKDRPLICLGNNGDRNGDPRPGTLSTCPASWIQLLARIFREEFPEGKVTLNTPYAGGFIAIAHYWHRGIPWIQIELNRSLYESGERGVPLPGAIDMRRVDELKERIWPVLTRFWDEIGPDSDP